MSTLARLPLRPVLPLVVVDARMVSAIPHGIAQYVTLMARGLKGLSEIAPLPYKLLFLVNSAAVETVFYPFETLPLNSPFLNPRELFEIPQALKKLKPTLYHSPSFSSLLSCPCPSIVTLHDLNHLTFGSWAKKIYYQTLTRRFSSRANVLITVSEFSRNEISAWLKKPRESIEVVYNAIEPHSMGPENHAGVLKKFSLSSGNYFFCLSNPKPHKNLPLLIEAYRNFYKQQQNAWPLVLNIGEDLGHPGIKPVGGLSTPEANALLTHAGGTLFPSLYEGFGLPPVEAALCGVPLAVSRILPHQEGLIDLSPSEVLWIQPKDLHGWVNAFHRLYRGEISPPSEDHRKKILSRFSIETLGQKMDQIYRHVLDSLG